MAKRKYVASFSSWFCIPDQGMKEMEILSRGSCFLLPSNSESFSHKFHVLTASHIVAPWRWPKFYPDEWLQYVDEKHTHYTLELRYDDGTFITQHELLPVHYHHDSRDLAVLHLVQECEALNNLSTLDFSPLQLAPEYDNQDVELQTSVNFHGHRVEGNGFINNEDDERKPIPMEVEGRVEVRTRNQTFAKTNIVLQDGMCGGPVTCQTTNDLNLKSTKAVGILEGIVPSDSPAVDYRELAVFLEASEIKNFLKNVENGKVETFLQGGEAARHVGASHNLDDKLDWQEVLTKHT